MLTPTEQLVCEHLAQFVSEHKKQGVEKVLSLRTTYVTVMLEDIFQSQNASAVIRTCECMGLQQVHIIENISKYSINPRVLKGANKWMDLSHYTSRKENNTVVCFEKLRSDGYKILVTDPSEDGISIHEIDITQGKIALLFGNELRGASLEALKNCDHKVTIPMYGFTESLNISVSVAMCLGALMNKLRLTDIDTSLTQTEKDRIRLHWYRKIVRKSDLIEREFLRTIH
jgi:tRNA (guanosine-2'-O-)-methyltransferase